jgi:hypothetical protein
MARMGFATVLCIAAGFVARCGSAPNPSEQWRATPTVTFAEGEPGGGGLWVRESLRPAFMCRQAVKCTGAPGSVPARAGCYVLRAGCSSGLFPG